MVHMVALNLNYCAIKILPSEVSRLTQLQHLHVCGNQLTFLPDQLFHDLVHLRVLNVSKNQLTELPHAAYKLHDLRELYARDNLLGASMCA